MPARDDKSSLPSYVEDESAVTASSEGQRRRKAKLSRGLRVVLGAVLSLVTLQCVGLSTGLWKEQQHVQVPLRAQEWLEKCQLLDVPPGPPPNFHARAVSDRFVPGTSPTLITVMGISYLFSSFHCPNFSVHTECDYLDWRE